MPGTDTAVLVNRGWVYAADAMSVDFARWREPNDAAVTGYLLEIPHGGRGAVSATSSPRVIRRLEYDSLAKRFPYPIAPFVLVATESSPGSPTASRDSTPARLPPPLLDEGPHLGYAIQWFAFAVIGLVGAGVVVRADRRGSHPCNANAAWEDHLVRDATWLTRHTLPSEKEARDVAESARETEWEHPSFARELFLGRFRLDLIHPHPVVDDPAEAARAKPFFDRLRAFLERFPSEEVDRTGEIPESHVQELRDMGAFGIKIPKEYGGLGLSQLSYVRAMEMVTSKDGSLVALLSASQSIGVPQPLKLFGTEEQKRKYFPRLAKGAISAFALTEVDAGSDPANMKTTATPTEDGKHFILNGQKLWCTNGTRADLFVVMARTPDVVDAKGKDAQADHGVHRRGDRSRASRSCTAAGSWGSRRSRTASSGSTTCACRARTFSGARGRDSSSRS